VETGLAGQSKSNSMLQTTLAVFKTPGGQTIQFIGVDHPF
jgi:hypothetical protein